MHSNGEICARTYIETEIEKLPAVDAVPVVHAKWIVYEADMHGTKPIECSACHYLFARIHPKYFCPNCGAKMENCDG